MNIYRRIVRKNNPNKFLEMIEVHEQFVKKHGIDRGAYLEFGVFQGTSALAFYNALKLYYSGQAILKVFPMYLYDSFEGLPHSDAPEDQHPFWSEGVFDVEGDEGFINDIIAKGLPRDQFECVSGFYEDSLATHTLPKGMKAAIVNMDCDYYSSTVTVLEYLKPYLQNFTLIYFDDLLSFAGNPRKGQLAAINEFNKKNSDIGICACPLF